MWANLVSAMVAPRTFLGLFLAGALAACSTAAPKQPEGRSDSTATHLECVPYARSISGVSIRGDAWTWWQTAAGRYRRDREPFTGAVMVLKRTERLPYGHVAVVSRVLNHREILVDHANWLNQGKVHRGLLVRDVSSGNDWSLVRVWYSPGNTLGKRSYPAYGFIHPQGDRALRLRQPPMRGPDVRALQEALDKAGLAVAVDGVFGRDTRDALIAYQTKSGLARDGVAGSRTRSSLGL
jgi:surface antigen